MARMLTLTALPCPRVSMFAFARATPWQRRDPAGRTTPVRLAWGRSRQAAMPAVAGAAGSRRGWPKQDGGDAMTPRVRWFVACLAVRLAAPVAGTFAIRGQEKRTSLPADEGPFQPREGHRSAPWPGLTAPVGLGKQKRPLPTGMGPDAATPDESGRDPKWVWPYSTGGIISCPGGLPGSVDQFSGSTSDGLIIGGPTNGGQVTWPATSARVGARSG